MPKRRRAQRPKKMVSPAELVVARFGGVREVSRALDVDASWVSRWRRPKAKQGAGGRVPSSHHLTLLDIAKARHIRLTAGELILGGKA